MLTASALGQCDCRPCSFCCGCGTEQPQGGRVLGPGECQIRLSHLGPSRAKLRDLRASDPVLVLTQYVRHASRPFYPAKCLIADRSGHRAVMQSFQY